MNNTGDLHSIYDNSGPTFGLGTDLYVSSDSNLNANNNCDSGFSYVAPNGHYCKTVVNSFILDEFFLNNPLESYNAVIKKL